MLGERCEKINFYGSNHLIITRGRIELRFENCKGEGEGEGGSGKKQLKDEKSTSPILPNWAVFTSRRRLLREKNAKRVSLLMRHIEMLS